MKTNQIHLFGGILLTAALIGCSPRLAPVSTSGVPGGKDSFRNYTQSTVPTPLRNTGPEDDRDAAWKALREGAAPAAETPAPAANPTAAQPTAPAVVGYEEAGCDDEPAAAPISHTFRGNETEHVKFSYYTPFAGNGNQFSVVLADQTFCYPYPGKFLSPYGPRGRSFHAGVDIKARPNDTIRAAFAGTVRLSRAYYAYGNCVVVRHDNGLETLYGHNSRNLVRVGDQVKAGSPLALAGRTGRATTEHCHFEVRIQGQHINPALLLDCQNQCLRPGTLVVTRSGDRITASNRSASLDGAPASKPLYVAASEPVAATPAAKPSATAAKSAAKPAAKPAAAGSSNIHTVVSGDTLTSIARRYGTTIEKLCQLNQIGRDDILSLGKKLRVR